jgi:hypothetical protein
MCGENKIPFKINMFLKSSLYKRLRFSCDFSAGKSRVGNTRVIIAESARADKKKIPPGKPLTVP